MFDGKTFLPVTGIPMRKIACMRRLFALAEPVPLTVPMRNAKSLAPVVAALMWPASAEATESASPGFQNPPFLYAHDRHTESRDRTASCPRRQSDNARRIGRSGDRRPHPSPSLVWFVEEDPMCRSPASG